MLSFSSELALLLFIPKLASWMPKCLAWNISVWNLCLASGRATATWIVFKASFWQICFLAYYEKFLKPEHGVRWKAKSCSFDIFLPSQSFIFTVTYLNTRKPNIYVVESTLLIHIFTAERFCFQHISILRHIHRWRLRKARLSRSCFLRNLISCTPLQKKANFC